MASAVQVAVGAANALRRVLRGPRARPLTLTFSPSRLCIAATTHWYRIDAARGELGYAPLWSLKDGLFVSLRAYADQRCMAPSEAALNKARAGNLVALGIVADPQVMSACAIA